MSDEEIYKELRDLRLSVRVYRNTKYIAMGTVVAFVIMADQILESSINQSFRDEVFSIQTACNIAIILFIGLMAACVAVVCSFKETSRKDEVRWLELECIEAPTEPLTTDSPIMPTPTGPPIR